MSCRQTRFEVGRRVDIGKTEKPCPTMCGRPARRRTGRPQELPRSAARGAVPCACANSRGCLGRVAACPQLRHGPRRVRRLGRIPERQRLGPRMIGDHLTGLAPWPSCAWPWPRRSPSRPWHAPSGPATCASPARFFRSRPRPRPSFTLARSVVTSAVSSSIVAVLAASFLSALVGPRLLAARLAGHHHLRFGWPALWPTAVNGGRTRRSEPNRLAQPRP